ncbi:MAG: hypothetical protein A2293_00130, partial [Elusimicrobia bacterium RIFOXYB2_FULL_49_7]
MNKPSLLLACPLPNIDLPELARSFTLIGAGDRRMERDEMVALLPNCQAMICNTSQPVDRAVLDAGPILRIISNFGVGYNHIDIAYAAQKGIAVTNTPDILTDATADLGFALILATCRRVGEGDRYCREGKFTGFEASLFLGQQVYGRTLGIVGCGRIGQAVARRASGFSMKCLYHNRKPLEKSLEQERGLQYADFNSLLEISDIILISTPLTPETRHLFTLEQFQRMKRSSVLVNISRGPVVKEAD